MSADQTTNVTRTTTGAGRGAAFTLIEILIVVVILGILAAIVVPQFSNASHVARENTLKDELRYLRTQIMVYKAQHRDVPPGYPPNSTSADATTFKLQMSMSTNDAGKTGQGKLYPLGPYLQKMPANPLTQATGVKVIADGAPMPKASQYAGDELTIGWIYKPQTMEIIPNSKDKDSRGRPYMEY